MISVDGMLIVRLCCACGQHDFYICNMQ